MGIVPIIDDQSVDYLHGITGTSLIPMFEWCRRLESCYRFICACDRCCEEEAEEKEYVMVKQHQNEILFP